MRRKSYLAASLVMVIAFAFAGELVAETKEYEVTITNLTKGQVLTPALIIAHNGKFNLFTPGKKASSQLATLAESGNPDPLMAKVEKKSSVFATAKGTGLITPGKSETISIMFDADMAYFSFASMFAMTNDAFAAVRGEMFADGAMFYANVWDAGSEGNTESAAHVPGLSGMGRHTADAEKFVYIHPGIHGGADLDPAMLDWNNPGVLITIKKVD